MIMNNVYCIVLFCFWDCSVLFCFDNSFYRRRAMVSRRFYELYGVDDGHDHKRNFEKSHHNPFDPTSHHSFYAIEHGHAKGHGPNDHGHGAHGHDESHDDNDHNSENSAHNH